MATDPRVQQVFTDLLARTGEAHPRPRREPVIRLTDLLGQPQTLYPVILVGGTNGKTSTSRVIESLLRAYGLKTGLFTSPHLVDFTERIRIDGEDIAPEALEAAWQEMQPALNIVDAELSAAGQSSITYFEALAALAYTAFADAPVEVAVVEVGMGGEWDATNITAPAIAVMTPIGLDHVGILGDTVEEIAATKSFIAWPGTTLVSSQQLPEAQAALEARVSAVDATLLLAGRDFTTRGDQLAVGGRVIEVTGVTQHEYPGVFVPLYGKHQTGNVTLAVAAVEAFIGAESALPQEVLEEGLGVVQSPGRLQTIGVQPHVLIDAAHNPDGARSLVAAMSESFSFDELMLVVGSFADKDTRGVLAELLTLTPHLSVVGISSDRTRNPEELAVMARELREDVQLQLFDDLEEALDDARNWAADREGRGVLVTGSVFLAGEALALARSAEWGRTE